MRKCLVGKNDPAEKEASHRQKERSESAGRCQWSGQPRALLFSSLPCWSGLVGQHSAGPLELRLKKNSIYMNGGGSVTGLSAVRNSKVIPVLKYLYSANSSEYPNLNFLLLQNEVCFIPRVAKKRMRTVLKLRFNHLRFYVAVIGAGFRKMASQAPVSPRLSHWLGIL